MDLSTLDLLVNVTPDDLAAIMSKTGKQSLFELGIEDNQNLVNQIDARSLAYAKARAAEMVGKKWVDGELVDNPDATWVITDATRNGIRDLVSQVQSGELKLTDLSDAIMNDYSFSEARSVAIARTETITANAEGTLASFRAARDVGVNVKKAWLPDADACEVCIENTDAGAIDIEDEFPSGDLAPAAHTHCECALISVTGDEETDAEE